MSFSNNIIKTLMAMMMMYIVLHHNQILITNLIIHHMIKDKDLKDPIQVNHSQEEVVAEEDPPPHLNYLKMIYIYLSLQGPKDLCSK